MPTSLDPLNAKAYLAHFIYILWTKDEKFLELMKNIPVYL